MILWKRIEFEGAKPPQEMQGHAGDLRSPLKKCRGMVGIWRAQAPEDSTHSSYSCFHVLSHEYIGRVMKMHLCYSWRLEDARSLVHSLHA